MINLKPEIWTRAIVLVVSLNEHSLKSLPRGRPRKEKAYLWDPLPAIFSSLAAAAFGRVMRARRNHRRNHCRSCSPTRLRVRSVCPVRICCFLRTCTSSTMVCLMISLGVYRILIFIALLGSRNRNAIDAVRRSSMPDCFFLAATD